LMVPLNWRQIAASGAIWRYFSRRGYLGIALMGWSSAEGETGASGWLESPFFAFAMAAPSQAQRPIPTPTAVPLPTQRIRPRPVWPTSAAIFWSGRRIIERADSSTPGEAIRAAAAPRRRLRGTIPQLGEVCGISTRTGTQLDFVVTSGRPQAVLPEQAPASMARLCIRWFSSNWIEPAGSGSCGGQLKRLKERIDTR
jgi:hypothetical protein